MAERCGMVYLTKSQRDSRALFLALGWKPRGLLIEIMNAQNP